MQLWDVDALVQDLRREKVSEHEKKKYFLAYTLGMVVILFNPTSKDLVLLFIKFLARIFIVCWGIQLCFRNNQKGDNKKFIERFVCLSVPVFIGVIFAFFVAAISALAVYAIAVVKFFKTMPSPREGAFIMDVFAYIALIGFFYFLSIYIEKVARR
jgi:hypothetical protein